MVHSKGRVYRMHLTIYMEDGACSGDTDILEKWCIENCKDFVFQIEESKAAMIHYQMVISLKKKNFTKKVLESISNYTNFIRSSINVQPSLSGNKSFSYAMKEETRIGGPWSNQALINFATLKTLCPTKFYNWQKLMYNISMSEPDDRTIYHILDRQGSRGKTQLVKYLAIKHPKEIGIIACTGSANQLVSSIIQMGVRKTYILDIPRSKGEGKFAKDKFESRIDELMFTIEQIKNGMLSSSMYGRNNEMFFNSPNVMVFTNYDLFGLSSDRWHLFDMDRMTPDDWACELDKFQQVQLQAKEEYIKEAIEAEELDDEFDSINKNYYNNYINTLETFKPFQHRVYKGQSPFEKWFDIGGNIPFDDKRMINGKAHDLPY